MTNYERIKNMSIEELAAMLCFSKCQNFCIYANTDECVERNGNLHNCKIGIMKYLESEVQEMSDKNFNEWLFSDMEDLIDCDYGEESDDENRMTDNEIIKALECCTTKGAKCSDCPAFKKVDRSDCKKYFRGAIDIINRQQEKIEKLNKEVEGWRDTAYHEASIRDTAEIKVIKEFAEKLKKRFYLIAGRCVVNVYQIDNLVKEMVGEE